MRLIPDIQVLKLQAFNDWEHNSYKIRLNEKRKQILDIPPACRSLQAYSATLAHKVKSEDTSVKYCQCLIHLLLRSQVNHSFFPNCRFSDFAHPRFGRILCVKASKGEEDSLQYIVNM